MKELCLFITLALLPLPAYRNHEIVSSEAGAPSRNTERSSSQDPSHSIQVGGGNSDVLEPLERHLQGIELFITIALSIGGVLITAGGGLVAFMQYRWEKETRHEWETWRVNFIDGQKEIRQERDLATKLFEKTLRESLDSWQISTKAQILEQCSDAAVADSRKMFGALSDELRIEVMEQTRVFSQEVLMQTPPARGMLYSRFSRLARDISAAIQDPQSGTRLQELLWQGVQDWHTLGQLYSVEHDQLKLGLGTLREHPIPEARDWLKALRTRHRDDSDLLAFLMEATTALEQAEQD